MSVLVSEPRWLDDAEQQAWRRFVTMQSRLQARLSQQLQRETGLSETDYEVLVNLSEAPDGALRAFELGEATQWEKSRLSHHLTRMVERGLVVRQACPTDNRGTFVHWEFSARGSRKLTVVPRLQALTMTIAPPDCVANPSTTLSPSPDPAPTGFVE